MSEAFRWGMVQHKWQNNTITIWVTYQFHCGDNRFFVYGTSGLQRLLCISVFIQRSLYSFGFFRFIFMLSHVWNIINTWSQWILWRISYCVLTSDNSDILQSFTRGLARETSDDVWSVCVHCRSESSLRVRFAHLFKPVSFLWYTICKEAQNAHWELTLQPISGDFVRSQSGLFSVSTCWHNLDFNLC